MLKYNICDGNKEYGRLNDTLPLIEKENTLSNTAIVFILTFFGKNLNCEGVSDGWNICHKSP